jgi:hypothetical protein
MLPAENTSVLRMRMKQAKITNHESGEILVLTTIKVSAAFAMEPFPPGQSEAEL